MNRKIVEAMRNASIVLAAALLLAGCFGRNYRLASSASLKIGDSCQLAAQTGQQAQSALVALDTLVNQQSGDLVLQFRAFTLNVKSLEMRSKEISSRHKSIQRKGLRYVKMWEKQLLLIEDPAIRQQSAQRRTQTMESLQQIGSHFRNTELAFIPLLTHLRDIRLCLGTDLTTLGIASAREQSGRVAEDVALLQKHLELLLGELERVGAELAPVVGAP